MPELRAGAASVRITPSSSVDLSGYAHREGAAEGVHDELWCRVLALDDGASRLALVGLDLLEVDFELDAAMREAVAEAAALEPDQVLLSCSHTHAGLAVCALSGIGVRSEDYVSRLVERVAEAGAASVADLRAGSLGYAEIAARAGINRRERMADGSVGLGRNPAGLTDSVVRVLRVDTGGAHPRAVVFHHACHGTVLGHENRMISADWMGAACARVTDRLGADVVALFLQGCSGQINPDVSEGSFEEVERVGGEIGDSVLEGAASAAAFRATPLAGRMLRIELPLQEPPPAAAAYARLKRAEDELAAARREGLHPCRIRAMETCLGYAEMLVRAAETGARDQTQPFVVQGLRVGELGIAALSGEVFLEFAHRIEARSPFRHTLVLGCSNGCTGYVPTAAAFAEGGYEAEDSFCWYGTLPLAPEAGDGVVDAGVRLLTELSQEEGAR